MKYNNNSYVIKIVTILLFGIVNGLLSPAYALQINFDYSYDTGGFFTDQITGAPIFERRARLEQAASFYTGFTDNLSAIQPTSTNNWSVNIRHPSLLGSSVTLTNTGITANTIRVFVGGSSSSPGVLGFAGTGWGLTTTGSQAFQDDVVTRGQLNTVGQSATDYGIWGGSIWFNDVHNWYFGEDEAGLTAGHPDFLTTATHELGHILGYGEADSWSASINANHYFEGQASTIAAGSLVPVDQFGFHWGEGVMSDRDGIAQEAMMDPTTPFGERQLPTTLDYAGFNDIGWEVTAVPLPSSLWLFGTAFLSLAGAARRRIGVK
jgi:hypothetical protein